MKLFSRLLAGLLLCMACRASAQEELANTGAKIFYAVRIFCTPTNAAGFVSYFEEKSETKRAASMPGRFWMNESTIVWQVEFASLSHFSAANRKKLRDLKMDQLRILIPIEGDNAYLIFPNAKAYIPTKISVPVMRPVPGRRYDPSAKPSEELPIVHVGEELFNGHPCRKHRLTIKDKGIMTVWLSSKHRDFPIKMTAATEAGRIMGGLTFTMVDFDPVEPTIFKVPDGYTEFKSLDHLKLRQWGVTPADAPQR